MSSFHYFPKVEDRHDLLGISEHTDYGCLTVLMDGVPGLQTFTRDGKWVDVPYVPGALLINVGLVLESWSKGVLNAVHHRVKSPAYQDRFSVAYFHDPTLETVIKDEAKFNGSEPVKKAEAPNKKDNKPKTPFDFGDYMFELYKTREASL